MEAETPAGDPESAILYIHFSFVRYHEGPESTGGCQNKTKMVSVRFNALKGQFLIFETKVKFVWPYVNYINLDKIVHITQYYAPSICHLTNSAHFDVLRWAGIRSR